MKIDEIKKQTTPIAIGGVGGSGTRLFSQILTKLGYEFGHDLNESFDNLWFTFLFKRVELLSHSDQEFNSIVDLFITALFSNTHLFKWNKFSKNQIRLIHNLVNDNREYQSTHWLQQRANSILNDKAPLKIDSKWGWKEPNTHVFLNKLKHSIPGLKYIHIMRNGLDMAFSSNQNQLKLWGEKLTPDNTEITPSNSLKFWCYVHKKILSNSLSMPHDFLLINYDEFCVQPDKGLEKLSAFLSIDKQLIKEKQIEKLITPPLSIGRHKSHDLSIFDPFDIDYVKQLGFKVYN